MTRTRFGLRTLVLSVCLISGVIGLWFRWEPWFLYAVFRGHNAEVNVAELSPGDSRIVTASDDNNAIVWDANTKRKLLILKGHTDDVISAEFSASGKEILTCSFDGTSRLWSAIDGSEKLRIEQSGFAIFPPDGKRIVDFGSVGYRTWNLRTKKMVANTNGLVNSTRTKQYSTDMGRTVHPGWPKTVTIYDTKSGRPLWKLRGHAGWVLSAGFSNSGNRIVTEGRDGNVHIYHRRRPEWWWGIAWLWEFWATAFFTLALAASLWKDWRRLGVGRG